jgi:hypothetical protein
MSLMYGAAAEIDNEQPIAASAELHEQHPPKNMASVPEINISRLVCIPPQHRSGNFLHASLVWFFRDGLCGVPDWVTLGIGLTATVGASDPNCRGE